jgi:shikimate kinase
MRPDDFRSREKWHAKPGRICYFRAVNGPRAIHNLALIGFMGSGKSSVGRLAADLLHFTFLDTDHVIEARAGATIAEIFAKQGEPAFRDWERRIVDELTRRNKTVIATGGGLPADPAHLASLKTHALVVCLWASPETLWERVREHGHRPLLNDPDPLARLRSLLAAREPFYRQADVLLNTERRSLREVATQLVHQFHTAQRAHG